MARPAIIFAKEYFKGEVNTIVEVGVRTGGHAFHMSTELNPKEFYLIDCYKSYIDTEDIFTVKQHEDWYKEANIYTSKLPNAHFILKRSQEAAVIVPNNLDLVYIDASHDELNVVIDIACWFPKLRIGGILCGHDYCSNPQGNSVSRAVHKLFNKSIVGTGEVDWWIIKTKENYA